MVWGIEMVTNEECTDALEREKQTRLWVAEGAIGEHATSWLASSSGMMFQNKGTGRSQV